MSLQELIRPDLVVFDLDNTFYDYDSAHKFALSIPLFDLQSTLGLTGSEIFDTFGKAKQGQALRVD